MSNETEPMATQGEKENIKPEENGDQLAGYENAEMTEDDAKIIKKRQKKNPNIPPELVEFARQQEKNVPIAQNLIGEAVSKLADLGFKLLAKLHYGEVGITPVVDLRPMNAAEVAEHKARKEGIAKMAGEAASKAVEGMKQEREQAQEEPAETSEEQAAENTEK